MQQVNFRLTDDEKRVLIALAETRGISIAELAKEAVLKEISAIRVDLAFQLLQEGKIGFKRAWTLSGLTYHEFLVEWSHRGAEEVISEEAEKKALKVALDLDLSQFLRNQEE
ncbi:MAG TPA: hypothetical protein VKK79_05240 [Candidatus Lokiarchaeia archaeon]|nr:hypothetical protein [Candidatus Lokiarchaeia archaeon]